MVVFACREGQLAESPTGYQRRINRSELIPTGTDIASCIHQYAARTLGSDEDYLNAFLGVLRSFEEQQGLRHHWGITFNWPRSADLTEEEEDRAVAKSSSQFLRRLGWKTPKRSGQNAHFRIPFVELARLGEDPLLLSTIVLPARAGRPKTRRQDLAGTG
jgi:hypothetical protein